MVGQDRATVVFEASTSQVAVARRFVRRTVTGHVPDDVVADLVLIASELFTNAVQYGRSATVTLTVDVGPDGAGVTVDCGGSAPDVGPIETWRLADEDEITGRGLGIVRRLADVIRVVRDNDRFAVAAHRTFPPRSYAVPGS